MAFASEETMNNKGKHFGKRPKIILKEKKKKKKEDTKSKEKSLSSGRVLRTDRKKGRYMVP